MPTMSALIHPHSGFTATLVCANLTDVVSAYNAIFNLTVSFSGTLSQALSNAWSKPELTDARFVVLTNEAGHPWLRIIELPDCQTPIPVNYFGWMALQLGINNLQSLIPDLAKHDFHVIGEPIFQDLGKKLTINQCIGPAGELLYLADNQQLCEVLNSSAFKHNNLLMPVLAATCRGKSAEYYARLSNNSPRFRESRLTVVNRALNKSIDCHYPVVSIPFSPQSILEINEIKALLPMPLSPQPLPSGIGMITVTIENVAQIANLSDKLIYQINDDFYQGRKAILLSGPDNELLECIIN